MIFISINNENKMDKNKSIKIDVWLYFDLSFRSNNSYYIGNS